MEVVTKKRFVFRVEEDTFNLLKAHCKSFGYGAQSQTIRACIANLNLVEPSQHAGWKAKYDEGFEELSVWADTALIAKAQQKANQHRISLSRYVDLAIRNSLAS